MVTTTIRNNSTITIPSLFNDLLQHVDIDRGQANGKDAQGHQGALCGGPGLAVMRTKKAKQWLNGGGLKR